MKKIFSITLINFLECLRNKVFLGLLIFSMASIACANFIRYITPGEDLKLLKDFGLGAIAFLGIAVSILLPITAVSREREKIAVFSALSEHVRRWEYILAKYIGVIMALLVAFLLMSAVFLGVLFLREKAFDAVMLKPVILLFFKFVIVAAFSIFFKIITTTRVLAVLLSFVFYIMGHMVDIMPEILQTHAETVVSKFILLPFVKILPNLSNFDISESVSLGVIVPCGYIIKLIVYSVIYSSVTLLLAIAIFQKKKL